MSDYQAGVGSDDGDYGGEQGKVRFPKPPGDQVLRQPGGSIERGREGFA